VVSGYSQTDCLVSTYHATLWTQGSITDLGSLVPGSCGRSLAFDLNNNGQIVGASRTSAGETHAALWTLAPPQPTSRDDCTNGGWKAYAGFKNQGACVSSLVSHGKNKGR
jgi:probable HAF family extracellular repeat protein